MFLLDSVRADSSEAQSQWIEMKLISCWSSIASILTQFSIYPAKERCVKEGKSIAGVDKARLDGAETTYSSLTALTELVHQLGSLLEYVRREHRLIFSLFQVWGRSFTGYSIISSQSYAQ